MRKTKLAVCMEDWEFRNRFTSCLMQFYGNDLEIHIYEELTQLLESEIEQVDCVILEGILEDFWRSLKNFSEKKKTEWKNKIIWLRDEEETVENPIDFMNNPQENVQIVDKFTNINQIFEGIREICPIEMEIAFRNNTEKNLPRLIGVYSLSETGFQLPFAITLGMTLSEKEKALLVDLQENSGIGEYCDDIWEMGLEELIVMMGESGKSFGSMNHCIGHIDRMDFIYPARNCESLCQIEAEHYQKVLDVLLHGLSYDVIILNFGSRFQGFCQMFSSCDRVYFLEGKRHRSSWRKREFLEELEQKGFGHIENQLYPVELPSVTGGGASCRRQVEEWQWGPFGDEIRSLCQKVAYYG